VAAPGLNIRVFDLTVYAPKVSTAIFGCVGPSTKGPVNELTTFTDEGNFVNFHGRPVDRQYGQRGALRYFRGGSQMHYIRVAGPNLATAFVILNDANGNPILTISAESAGTWANGGDLQVAVTFNGTSSYNILVYFLGQLVESHVAQDNGIIVNTLLNQSSRIRAALAFGAGATFPATTVDQTTGEIIRQSMTSGNDGAFAQSNSVTSSSSGIAGKRFYGKMDAAGANRVFRNLQTIGAALAGLDTVRGTVGMAVTPGTFTIRTEVSAGTYVELSDDEDFTYLIGGAGLGYLTDATGNALGFIDYRTGSWGVDISAVATSPVFFNTGSIDAIWVRAVSESVGGTSTGVGNYTGSLSQGPVGVGFYNANKVAFTVPISMQAGIHTAGGAGAASSLADVQTLPGWLIPGTVVLSVTHATLAVPPAIWDDGFGRFRTGPNGTGLPVPGGTIDYRTGAFAVTTWDPVGAVALPAGAAIGARCDIILLDMGGGAVPGQAASFINNEIAQNSDAGGDALAADSDLGAQRINGPIQRATVKLTISDVGGIPEVYYDDGIGGWLDRPRGDPRAVAAIAGAIDYVTGAWSITASGAIAAAATIVFDYATNVLDLARRQLRGTGPMFRADTTPNAAGMNLDEPTTANGFNTSNWLDHRTGAFAFDLDLITTGDRTFNVIDNGTMTAVYIPADLLGFGDGAEVTFAGTLAPAPFRREANRLQGFQGAQASTGGAGDPQVTFATLGVDPSVDSWDQNVVASTDADNDLDFRDGTASIKWTGAPLADEAVFVVAEEVVLHFESRYPGDIGNERPTLTDGLYITVSEDPTLADTLRAQVFFNGAAVESFGQAADVAELVLKINDSVNGSDFIRAASTPTSATILADVLDTNPQSSGMSGAFTNADVVGTKVGQTTTGLQMFRNEDVVPLNWVMIPGQWHRQVVDGIRLLCERPGRRCLGIIPAPDADDPFDHRDFFNGNWQATSFGGAAVPSALVPFPPLVEINSNQMATIVPWVQYFDQYTNKEVFEPADGDMAELISKTPEPWFPIAGFRRGQVRATSIRYSVSKEDRELLQGTVGTRQEIVNPIIRKEGRGLVLFGQQTAARTPSSLDRINVRWTVNVIMNILDAVSQEFIFEINDAILWREIEATLNDTLKPIIARRGLQDAYVVIDATTTTPTDQDQLTVNAKLFIKPQRAAEFINYDLILTPSGADFADVIAAG